MKTKKEVLINAIENMKGDLFYVLQNLESDNEFSGMFFNKADKQERINYFNDCFTDDLQHFEHENLTVVGYYNHSTDKWVMFDEEVQTDVE